MSRNDTKDNQAVHELYLAINSNSQNHKSHNHRNNLAKLVSPRKFLADKIPVIAINLSAMIILLPFLFAFRARAEIIILTLAMWLVALLASLIIEYYRKAKFYRGLANNLQSLDQAYLILETLEQPKSYDGEFLYQVLYRINKSMAENVTLFRERTQDFKEYVEMWIHEVKTPLTTLAVISRDPRVNEQIKRLDDYVEQILYFTRSENAERDYLIKPVELTQVVGIVANRNREILQAKSIDFIVKNLDQKVYTDAKWLEFIINQIITNSIKYHAHVITISAESKHHATLLKIRDNGVGINEKDLARVFDKSFTGSNGRIFQKTTGMGLYIAKSLCKKLGHQISIQSEQGKYTELTIEFFDNEYYNVFKTNSSLNSKTVKSNLTKK